MTSPPPATTEPPTPLKPDCPDSFPITLSPIELTVAGHLYHTDSFTLRAHLTQQHAPQLTPLNPPSHQSNIPVLHRSNLPSPPRYALTKHLEAIAQFQRQHGRRSRDSARRAAHAVRSAIARFHEHLAAALGEDGGRHPVLGALADHMEKHILIPSARYARQGGSHAGAGVAGCFTYEPPGGVSWWP